MGGLGNGSWNKETSFKLVTYPSAQGVFSQWGTLPILRWAMSKLHAKSLTKPKTLGYEAREWENGSRPKHHTLQGKQCNNDDNCRSRSTLKIPVLPKPTKSMLNKVKIHLSHTFYQNKSQISLSLLLDNTIPYSFNASSMLVLPWALVLEMGSFFSFG